MKSLSCDTRIHLQLLEYMIKKTADQIITHEGLRLKPYRCPAGKLTIGVGRNLEDKGITEMMENSSETIL